MDRWKNPGMVAAVWVVWAVLAGPAGGLTHYVNPGESIQAAIDDANDGDEIEVAPGTYYEAINFNGRGLRLYSSGGPDITTIDANGIGGAYHVVQCVSGEDANTILEGFTITGGNGNGASYPDDCGGGMYNYGSSPTVINCIFRGNTVNDTGGGMLNWTNSNPTVTDCVFIFNSAADYGGGMCNHTSSPTVTNCTFSGNEAAKGGGGMANYSSVSLTVTNCTFSGNSAGWDGGGMYNWESSLTVANCLFSSNTADCGGGMINNVSSPTVTNCTFSGNSASTSGGGIYNLANSSAIVTNCILWNDTPNEISNNSSIPTVTYSDVQGGWPGPGNTDADPLFVSAAEGDLRLSSSASPCVDTGDNGAPGLPATDLAGNPRVVDGDRNGTAFVDMGAYEFQCWLIHNITQDDWYETIQIGVDYSNNGDEIEVAPGTYNEAIDFKGKAIRLYSSGGPEVTTIDGNGAYHTVQCVSGEDINTILEGFTITGGNANGSGYHEDRGGGMYNYESSPTLTNCTFISNQAFYHGGGMYNGQFSSPTVDNCTFTGNEASEAGGGMFNEISGSPTVTNCTFSNNSASSSGGGIYVGEAVINNCIFSDNSAYSGGGMSIKTATVTNCTFNNNRAVLGRGGGMSIGGQSSATVANCTFLSNQASSFGGGMYNYNDSSPTVSNCTFSGNVAEGGGGISNYDGNPTVTNCILWGDTPDEIHDFVPSITTVTYSDVEGGWPGTANIDADPRFVDASNPDPNLWNLRLKPDSPCIDRADSTALLTLSALVDLDGNFRCFDVFTIPNTGHGPLKFLDMGAYEFHCINIAGDINCDGVVDLKDMAMLAGNWLAGTEPE